MSLIESLRELIGRSILTHQGTKLSLFEYWNERGSASACEKVRETRCMCVCEFLSCPVMGWGLVLRARPNET